MIDSHTQDGYPISIPDSFHGYKVLDYLGHGCTCIVVLVEDQRTHIKYSAKIMSVNDLQKRNMLKSVEREIKVLQELDHPHIIKVQETFEIRNKNEEYYVIIMEYCQNGDLLAFTINNGFQNEKEKKKIIIKFLEAIKYLHNKGISHGDIKSENILLDSSFSPKLCDFGFCRDKSIAGDDDKNGTLYYAAPELFVKGQFDPKKVDIWAIGITLYSLFELQFPFKDGKQSYIVKQIINHQLSISKKLNSKIRCIVEKCTSMNPSQRPTIDDILQSEYFSENQSQKKNNNIMKSNKTSCIENQNKHELKLEDKIPYNQSEEEIEIYESIFAF